MSNVEPVVENLDDLPDALKKQLSKAFMKGSTTLDTFVVKLEPILASGPKNVDEVILGWWKEYNQEVLIRGNTQQKLGKAVKEGKILAPSKAVYALLTYKAPKKAD